ncbi:MAG: TrkH family potassium uptake protein [Ruminococcaceae bacterium]|nr:TrkH family potassium uptake protein [Oscillospiraceae bacterium]
MNLKMIAKFLGTVLLIEAILLVAPLAVALIYGESVLPYLITIAALLAVFLPTKLLKPEKTRIFAKEGFVCTALSWILLSAFGAIPFVISGAIPNYIDAFFETVSGFTTTGASIIPAGQIEGIEYGILFWRSFTHWIGGMGILVFMLALIPKSEGNVFLMRAEVPGPQKGKLVPKLRDSSLILYEIYLALTVMQIIALLFTGMPLYDCVVTAFGTMGTGGFSVLNDSIAGYHNVAAEWIITIFLFLAGINYNIYFFIIVKKFCDVKKNEELRTYTLITLASVGLITANLMTKMGAVYTTFGKALRDSFFQVTSILSTAGFTTASFNLWPNTSQSILVILMFIGACAGSTAGGFKISRLLIVLKSARRDIRKFFKPNSVKTLRLDGDSLSEDTVKSAVSYLAVYIVFLFAAILLVSFDGKDLVTTSTSVIACFNNIGPAFGEAFASYASFSYFSKIVLSFVMLFGRLEIMPMLILLSPGTWQKN